MATEEPDVTGADGHGEWRHGWYRYGGVGCDWREWRLDLSLGFKWHHSVGAGIHLGPFWAYVSLEEEDRLFVDGKDAECAMAPVEGYR